MKTKNKRLLPALAAFALVVIFIAVAVAAEIGTLLFLSAKRTLLALAICFVLAALLWLLLRRVLRGSAALAPGSSTMPGEKRITLITMVVLMLLTVMPMGACPLWNGEIPEHRDEYEHMADALLEGHLYMDYGEIDPRLLAMENPYDPQARTELGLEINGDFRWDHAFYNGRYYMYFGIVPALLLFVPFKAITGTALVTYHATQIFTVAIAAGIFLLFRRLAARFFPTLSLFGRMLFSTAASLVSVWYFMSTPALYCTAISGAVCMEIWSFYFFFRAVYGETNENRQIGMAALGSLFGALAFGCRPPVALANFVVIPLLVCFLKNHKPVRGKLIAKLVLAALPYIIIGALLMLYNYVRFGSVLEFGQTYQLTNTDQHLYGNILSNFHPMQNLRQLFEALLGGDGGCFPGLFIEYPLFLLLVLLISRRTRSQLRDDGLRGIAGAAIVTVLLTIAVQILTSPYLQERYKSDYLWLLCLTAFLVSGAAQEGLNTGRAERLRALTEFLSVDAALVSIPLFLWPYELNVTMYFMYEENGLVNILRGLFRF